VRVRIILDLTWIPTKEWRLFFWFEYTFVVAKCGAIGVKKLPFLGANEGAFCRQEKSKIDRRAKLLDV
jgi:hypothetical protein